MYSQFWLNAGVKIAKSDDIIVVQRVVNSKFIVDLGVFYSECLLSCVKTVGTSKLELENIELTVEDGKEKITANVHWTHQGEIQKARLEFAEEDFKAPAIGIYRLFTYMEAEAIKQLERNFVSLGYVQIVPFEKDDVSESSF